MEAEGIFLKKIDRKAYRKLKSIAAERGVPVYRLLNEALAEYVSRSRAGSPQDDPFETLEEADNAAFEGFERDKSLGGKWVGLADGEVVATRDDEEAVVSEMRKRYSKKPFAHGIIARVGETAGKQHEWLAGSIQQV